jgi:hypothetical protein
MLLQVVVFAHHAPNFRQEHDILRLLAAGVYLPAQIFQILLAARRAWTRLSRLHAAVHAVRHAPHYDGGRRRHDQPR